MKEDGLTDSVEQSPLDKVIAPQLVKKFHTPCGSHFHSSLSLVPILSQTDSVPLYFFKIKFNNIPSMPRSSKCLFPLHFPTKTLFAFVFPLIHATWPTHLILLDLFIWIIFGECKCHTACHYAISSTVQLLPPS